MPTVKKSLLMPYSTGQIYRLVDDIPAYPQFLPWCHSSSELLRTEDEVRARVEIAHAGIHKTFTTQNRLQKNKIIEMRLVEGPFRQLEGFWRFDELDDNACRVSLDLDFEFSNRLVALAFGPLFNQVANTLVDAFNKRAKQLYGTQ